MIAECVTFLQFYHFLSMRKKFLEKMFGAKIPYRLYQRLIGCMLVSFLFLLVLKIWAILYSKKVSDISFSSFNNERKINPVDSAFEVPSFSHLTYCPACFGHKMCQELDVQALTFYDELHIENNRRVLWRNAIINNEQILISSPTNEEWDKFDEFICHNSSQANSCDLPTSIRKTILGSEDIMRFDNTKTVIRLHDSPGNKILLSLCGSQRLLKELTKAFDDDFDGYTSKEEQIILFTSLIMHPGYVVMKLQSKTGMTMPIPNLLGACGRSIIVEGGINQLREFLAESFKIRARLAVQVLQLVEDFEDEDTQWSFVYTEFSLDSLAVTKEGDVFVLDLEELIILDKSIFHQDSSQQKTADSLCNIVCFQRLTEQLIYSSNSSACFKVSLYRQLMYAIICKQVLSDLSEHKSEGFFNFDGHKVHKKSVNLGLLHTMPTNLKEHMEDLIRECVQETSPHGRIRAVEEIRETLEILDNPNVSFERNRKNHRKSAFHVYKNSN